MKFFKCSDSTPKLVCRIILIAMIISTISFAYINSLQTQEQSKEQSSVIGDIIGNLLPTTTPLGSFVQKYLRKIAHFTEYGLLGAEIATYVLFFTQNKKKWVPVSIIFTFFVGFIDETIQIFSKRGSSVMDVWIDFAGCLTYSLVTYAIALTVIWIRRFVLSRRSAKKEMEKSQNG